MYPGPHPFLLRDPNSPCRAPRARIHLREHLGIFSVETLGTLQRKRKSLPFSHLGSSRTFPKLSLRRESLGVDTNVNEGLQRAEGDLSFFTEVLYKEKVGLKHFLSICSAPVRRLGNAFSEESTVIFIARGGKRALNSVTGNQGTDCCSYTGFLGNISFLLHPIV